MDTDLHVSEKVDEALSGTRAGDILLNMLTETVRELEAVRRRNHGMLGPAEEDRVEREHKESVLRALRELTVVHSEAVTAWREACQPITSPPDGSDPSQSSTEGPERKPTPCPDSFGDTLKSIGGDTQIILEKLSTIVTKLDTEILHLSAGEVLAANAAHQETSEESEDGNSRDHHRSDSNVEDGGDRSHARLFSDPEQMSDVIFCNDVEESEKKIEVICQVDYKKERVSLANHMDSQEKTEKDVRTVNFQGREEMKSEWITVGLTGEVDDSQPHVPDACFIKAPAGVAEVLRCEAADAFSCLMVTGSEELVSRVVRVKVEDGADLLFPVTLALPFRTCYRSNYRDIVVKMVDEAGRVSCVAPVTVDGACGGQRGTFSEVRVYSLGLFAVISCLKIEHYTVSSRGLSVKLAVDPRISLSYLPGSFTASVMAQITVQPVDATLLAAVKSRSDAYRSVLSTSPLLYLTQPTTQPLRRPLSVTLPCPPDPDRKRPPRDQREEKEHHYTSSDSHGVRILKSSKEKSHELLVALGSKDKQWDLLENVTIRNQQNGLVSLELTVNLDRLLVVRLLPPLQPCHLASLAEELEESACSHVVTIIVRRRKDEPHVILVAALPSRDLAWEPSDLQAQGYSDVLEASSEISVREGDQLLPRFSGNITCTGFGNTGTVEHITFHTQRRNHLLVHLSEVDPFGNHSSPHYKGTVMFYKVSRDQLAQPSDRAVPKHTGPLGDPVCKMSLTLPKKARSISRPVAAKMKLREETDSLSDSLLLWLCGELSEEDVALLVLSLRLSRSTAQLVKLWAGADPSAQAFHMLSMWRRGLPAAPHPPKACQLAQGLTKSGRPDLARELLLRQAAATRQGSLKQEGDHF